VYLEGAGFATIFNDLWPLALIGSVTLPTAAWLFRHRLV
jgi:ABC-2 type transport system permease protein